MEIELNRFTPAEQATFRLRALYEQAGYRIPRSSPSLTWTASCAPSSPM